MSGFTHFLKTIFIPLILAGTLYLLLAHLLLPLFRRHRSRYTHYLPVSLSPQSPSTTSFRSRVSSALSNLFLPRSWHQRQHHTIDGSTPEDELFDDEEGEGMVGFDPISERRREALEQRRSMGGMDGAGDAGRLGRELEEGFRDESDESGSEDEEGGDGRTSLVVGR
ncbi:hypothetical protein B0J11DRAFT_309209 [Dendryphion nanum]|uniref:Uncharacterized protein n=1 Tax=Dendryphion nanum TaxID=256645 RepID=A0A9P9ING9_9PLEO|nr:hypothetical protein B0J11DRAFT_309209 [Dendryphion nanum]